MKVIVTFKDPDGVYESVKMAVDDYVSQLDLSDEEKIAIKRVKKEQIKEVLSKWIEWNEYLSVEFDIDGGTAKILEN